MVVKTDVQSYTKMKKGRPDYAYTVKANLSNDYEDMMMLINLLKKFKHNQAALIEQLIVLLLIGSLSVHMPCVYLRRETW